MKLLEAHRIVGAPADDPQPPRHFVLASGFTPLLLQTFLNAYLRQRTNPRGARVTAGRFGDLPGNLERAAAERPDGVAVAIEWADVDPRLGARGHGAVAAPGAVDEILASAERALERIAARIAQLAAGADVAVCLPTLPLPPYFLDLPDVAGRARLRLDALLARFAAAVGERPRVRVVDAARLAAASPMGARWDVAGDLATGFPYTREHAEQVGRALAAALLPPPPKKGLVTDLDDTLWRGIVGEVGAGGVSWALEHGTHVHALYQQCLANLIEAGVLVAVASKNEAALVAEALGRDDFVEPAARLYPVHASWGPKSAALRSILATWNVGADSVVFVDDSPLELAEVQSAFPEVECLQFRPDSPAAVLELLRRLADLFGRETVRDEDRLRAESIRNAEAFRAGVADEGDADGFLASLDAQVELAFGRDAGDARALELVNKTNQFNLNGRRHSAGDWEALLARPDAFLATVSYRDKFGPLGKIAVVAGTASDGEVRVEAWVLSCRAFARRIEHLTLKTLFERFGAERVVLDVVRTARNGPLQEFVASLGAPADADGPVTLARAEVERRRPALHHAALVLDAAGAAGTAA
jgi:FkbH-like protein